MFTRRKPMLESDLEKALIEHIEDFLLELGEVLCSLVCNKELALLE